MGELATIDRTSPPAPPVAPPRAVSLLVDHDAPWGSPDRAGGAIGAGSLAMVVAMTTEPPRAQDPR